MLEFLPMAWLLSEIQTKIDFAKLKEAEAERAKAKAETEAQYERCTCLEEQGQNVTHKQECNLDFDKIKEALNHFEEAEKEDTVRIIIGRMDESFKDLAVKAMFGAPSVKCVAVKDYDSCDITINPKTLEISTHKDCWTPQLEHDFDFLQKFVNGTVEPYTLRSDCQKSVERMLGFAHSHRGVCETAKLRSQTISQMAERIAEPEDKLAQAQLFDLSPGSINKLVPEAAYKKVEKQRDELAAKLRQKVTTYATFQDEVIRTVEKQRDEMTRRKDELAAELRRIKKERSHAENREKIMRTATLNLYKWVGGAKTMATSPEGALDYWKKKVEKAYGEKHVITRTGPTGVVTVIGEEIVVPLPDNM